MTLPCSLRLFACAAGGVGGMRGTNKTFGRAVKKQEAKRKKRETERKKQKTHSATAAAR